MIKAKISVLDLAGTPVHSIADGALLVCLAPTITKELIDAVAELDLGDDAGTRGRPGD
jgi:hypothetical protein